MELEVLDGEGKKDEEKEEEKEEISLAQHRRSHELPEELSTVKCQHCHYIYAYNPGVPRSTRRAQQQLNCHMNEEHAELKLKCPQPACDKTFWTEKQLSAHQENHRYTRTDEGDYRCDHCDYKCKKVPRLKFHINAVHLGVRPHLCDFCPAAFPTKGALNTHRLSHTGERNFPCMSRIIIQLNQIITMIFFSSL